MRKAWLLGLLLLGWIGSANATCSSVPFSFTAGTTAVSSQVNSDFTAVVNCMNNGSITSLGTITTGVWQGTAIDVSFLTGLGTAATVNTGTSAGTLGLLNTNNTYSGSSTFSAGVTMSGIPNASPGDIVCINPVGGALSYATSANACAVSARRFKNPLDALSPFKAAWAVLDWSPGTWTLKGNGEEHVGLYADELCKSDPLLCIRDEQGEIQSYDWRGAIAYLTAAVQFLLAAAAVLFVSLLATLGGLLWRARRA